MQDPMTQPDASNEALTDEVALLRQELASLRQRVAQLEALATEYRATETNLAWLATFPEQNPNLVIETDVTGRVSYLNPVAQAQFPDLWTEGFAHPLLRDLRTIVIAFESGNHSYVAREIDSGDAVYEQKICYTRHGDMVRVRVYASDITRRKRAEEGIQRLAKQVVFAQEEERHRVSRELHDEAGQALTALKLGLALMRNELPPEAEALRRNLAEAVALADATQERIRLLAHGLRPPALDTVGLNLTLEAFCRDFSKRTQLQIHYEGADVRELPDAMNICLYRVLQEALTNVARHAGAGQVEVKLLRDATTVSLIVADNGRGLPRDVRRSARSQPQGIGLVGMRERLEMLGGRLEIESGPGGGTRLVACLPEEERG
jgi:signal transduction histidine kinase